MGYKQYNNSGLYEFISDIHRPSPKMVLGRYYDSHRSIKYNLAALGFPRDQSGEYLSMESNKHKTAKLLMSMWLSKFDLGAWATQESRKCLNKDTAIYTELPIFKNDSLNLYVGRDHRWDIIKPYTIFNTSRVTWHASQIHGKDEWWFIPDIAILYRGVPIMLIEIVHQHELDKIKKDRITEWYSRFNFGARVRRIKADELLEMTESQTVEFLVNFFKKYEPFFVDIIADVDRRYKKMTK